MYLAIPGCNVSITFGNGRGKDTNDLLATVGVVSKSESEQQDSLCAGHALVLIGSSAWYRVTDIKMSDSDLVTPSMSFNAFGLRNTTIYATQSATAMAVPLPSNLAVKPHLVFPLAASNSTGTGTGKHANAAAGVVVGISSIATDTLSTIQAKLSAARTKNQEAGYSKFGKLAETAEAGSRIYPHFKRHCSVICVYVIYR